MKFFFLLSVIVFTRITTYPAIHFSPAFFKDTIPVVHQLDGNTEEWPGEMFKVNNETGIMYATDNDNQNLFLALLVPDMTIQKRMIYQGMLLYIDTKGKKKEDRGIEFPVYMMKGEGFQNQQNTQPDSWNKNLGYMKLFGFTKLPLFIQSIQTAGTANIAFTWDSSYVMHIEYSIPLRILNESLASLNNKPLSIGWKVNEAEIKNTNFYPETRMIITVTQIGIPSPPRTVAQPPLNRPIGATNLPPPPQPKKDLSAKAYLFWTTHNILLK